MMPEQPCTVMAGLVQMHCARCPNTQTRKQHGSGVAVLTPEVRYHVDEGDTLFFGSVPCSVCVRSAPPSPQHNGDGPEVDAGQPQASGAGSYRQDQANNSSSLNHSSKQGAEHGPLNSDIPAASTTKPGDSSASLHASQQLQRRQVGSSGSDAHGTQVPLQPTQAMQPPAVPPPTDGAAAGSIQAAAAAISEVLASSLPPAERVHELIRRFQALGSQGPGTAATISVLAQTLGVPAAALHHAIFSGDAVGGDAQQPPATGAGAAAAVAGPSNTADGVSGLHAIPPRPTMSASELTDSLDRGMLDDALAATDNDSVWDPSLRSNPAGSAPQTDLQPTQPQAASVPASLHGVDGGSQPTAGQQSTGQAAVGQMVEPGSELQHEVPPPAPGLLLTIQGLLGAAAVPAQAAAATISRQGLGGTVAPLQAVAAGAAGPAVLPAVGQGPCSLPPSQHAREMSKSLSFAPQAAAGSDMTQAPDEDGEAEVQGAGREGQQSQEAQPSPAADGAAVSPAVNAQAEGPGPAAFPGWPGAVHPVDAATHMEADGEDEDATQPPPEHGMEVDASQQPQAAGSPPSSCPAVPQQPASATQPLVVHPTQELLPTVPLPAPASEAAVVADAGTGRGLRASGARVGSGAAAEVQPVGSWVSDWVAGCSGPGAAGGALAGSPQHAGVDVGAGVLPAGRLLSDSPAAMDGCTPASGTEAAQVAATVPLARIASESPVARTQQHGHSHVAVMRLLHDSVCDEPVGGTGQEEAAAARATSPLQPAEHLQPQQEARVQQAQPQQAPQDADSQAKLQPPPLQQQQPHEAQPSLQQQGQPHALQLLPGAQTTPVRPVRCSSRQHHSPLDEIMSLLQPIIDQQPSQELRPQQDLLPGIDSQQLQQLAAMQAPMQPLPAQQQPQQQVAGTVAGTGSEDGLPPDVLQGSLATRTAQQDPGTNVCPTPASEAQQPPLPPAAVARVGSETQAASLAFGQLGQLTDQLCAGMSSGSEEPLQQPSLIRRLVGARGGAGAAAAPPHPPLPPAAPAGAPPPSLPPLPAGAAAPAHAGPGLASLPTSAHAQQNQGQGPPQPVSPTHAIGSLGAKSSPSTSLRPLFGPGLGTQVCACFLCLTHIHWSSYSYHSLLDSQLRHVQNQYCASDVTS